mmetsp:Transcript_64700/g.88859  ORF Transcript_64700/g.88859 Transcript_64700/m.88859 type:complete len:87 (+) Transcript_64700:85-345(+)
MGAFHGKKKHLSDHRIFNHAGPKKIISVEMAAAKIARLSHSPSGQDSASAAKADIRAMRRNGTPEGHHLWGPSVEVNTRGDQAMSV